MAALKSRSLLAVEIAITSRLLPAKFMPVIFPLLFVEVHMGFRKIGNRKEKPYQNCE
jgi:hypothetical protein